MTAWRARGGADQISAVRGLTCSVRLGLEGEAPAGSQSWDLAHEPWVWTGYPVLAHGFLERYPCDPRRTLIDGRPDESNLQLRIRQRIGRRSPREWDGMMIRHQRNARRLEDGFSPSTDALSPANGTVRGYETGFSGEDKARRNGGSSKPPTLPCQDQREGYQRQGERVHQVDGTESQ